MSYILYGLTGEEAPPDPPTRVSKAMCDWVIRKVGEVRSYAFYGTVKIKKEFSTLHIKI